MAAHLSSASLCRAPWRLRASVLCLALAALFACGSETFVHEDTADLGAGRHCELSITEALVWPQGPDETPWFELHHRGPEVCSLAGTTALIEGAQGEPLERILLPSQMAPDGLELVRSLAPGRRRHPLAARGRLVVRSGSHTLLRWAWGAEELAGAPSEGRAQALEPWDDAATQGWCTVSATPYDGSNMGSPGSKNPGCDTCRDADGALRVRRRPQRGELELVALHIQFAGRNQGRQRVVLRSHAAEPRDVADLALRVAAVARAERRWRLVAPSCATLAAGEQIEIAVGSATDAHTGRWLFSGPTLPQADALASLLVGDVVLDEAVVPRTRLGVPTLPLRDPNDVYSAHLPVDTDA